MSGRHQLAPVSHLRPIFKVRLAAIFVVSTSACHKLSEWHSNSKCFELFLHGWMEVSDRLECILTPATWWTPIKMCNRRNKPICQGALLLALVGGLGYTMYLYSNISMDLEISRSETDKYFKQQESLSSQLQGVCSFVVDHRRKLLIVSSILMNLYIGEEPVKFFFVL